MLDRFRLRYPALYVISMSLVLPLICLPLVLALPGNRSLSVVATLAFIAALAFNILVLLESLYVERGLPDRRRFWRMRYAVVSGYGCYLLAVLALGTGLPGTQAGMALAGGAACGIACAYLVPHDRIRPLTGLFDTAKPIWSQTKGEWLWQALHVGLGLLALALSMVKPKDEAYSIFVMILILPLIQPYFFSGPSFLRRIGVPLLSTAFLLTGLFLA
ncbi:MAG: hypothetical protein LW715_03515 [Rhodobacter sp.]|jgi:hypothetical protein|nr:hypothetical protein [Rhodobacter sp.]